MKISTKIMLWAGFIVYGLVLFFVLTFYRLPADKILSGTLDRMTHGKILLSVEKRSSSFWQGHRLEGLTWTIDPDASALVERMESLTLSPNLFRLFQGYVPINMKGVIAKGSFKGSAGISMLRGLKKGYASLEALGIELENLGVLNTLAQRQIKGKLNGQAELYGNLNDLMRTNGQGTIVVEDGEMDIKADVFGLRTLPFTKLTLPLTLKNGVTDLKGGEIRSPLFGGDFEGQIKLHHDLQASPIQVKARIIPGPSSHDGQAGKSPARGARPIVIELRGTIGNPLISWTGALP